MQSLQSLENGERYNDNIIDNNDRNEPLSTKNSKDIVAVQHWQNSKSGNNIISEKCFPNKKASIVSQKNGQGRCFLPPEENVFFITPIQQLCCQGDGGRDCYIKNKH